jgi:hypothetical protein
MSVLQQVPDRAPEPVASVEPADRADWAEETRRILTRDLLVRAAQARPGEARALEFRALHLNLPLVGEVCGRLGLTVSQRRQVEHHALDGLHEAVRAYDPFGTADFTELASAYVEEHVLRHLPRPALRLAVHRVALAIARA